MDNLNSKRQSKKIEHYLDSFTHAPFFGFMAVLLQIIGFVFMLKYWDKKPKLTEIHKMLDKEKMKHPDDMKYDKEIGLAPFMDGGRSEPMNVTTNIFYTLWFRSRIPIFLILFGLFMQLLPFFT